MINFNEMSKMTRFAIVFSLAWFFLWLFLGFVEKDPFVGLIIAGAPLVLYWGYRFVNEGTNIK